MINNVTATANFLETNIGRLGPLGMAIPFIHHFLSHLRDLHSTAIWGRLVKINGKYSKDLQLMLNFLKMANVGVSLNSIAFWQPTHVYRSNSCPAGLGRYNHKGFAWRWCLPENLKFRASNNLLDHLAAIILPWVDILAGRLNSQDCVLSMTDSTTAEGWLKKSNFGKLGESKIQSSVRIEEAQMQATLFMSLGIKNYSQWFKEESNKVSDALSRDDDRDDKELTNIFWTFCPSQIPSHFQIVLLPNKITSWLIALLQKLPVNLQYNEVHMQSKLGHGSNGASIAKALGMMTSSLNPSPDINGLKSLEPLLWLYAKDGFQDQLMTNWFKAQSLVPFHMYARPSKKTASQTFLSTKMPGLASFYSDSIKDSKMQTQQNNIRKQSQFPAAEQWRTQILRLRNIRFFWDGKLINHNDDELEFSDCILLTFKKQKKDRKMDTITQMASGDVKLCPVHSAAAIVWRIRGYPGTTSDTPISTIMINGWMTHVTSKNIINPLQDAVVAIGEHWLSINRDEIGTHSIRSGAAMAMSLGECAIFTIMLIGRWSSDVFLQYICKQVMEFSQNVAKKILTYQNFCHIPDIHRRILRDDPRQHNNPNNAKTRWNVGG